MIFQLIVSIVIVILGLTIFFVARKYEKYQPVEKKNKWESIFAYGKSLSSKYKFTENDVNEEIFNIRELNKKIVQNPIAIKNGTQIREINRSTMLNNINEQNIHKEIETDGPVGKEIW